MTKRKVAAAMVAVNVALTPLSEMAEASAVDLTVCKNAVMTLFVEFDVVEEMTREDGHRVIVLDVEQFLKLSPENQAFVADCKAAIEGIDDDDPNSWPLHPDEESLPAVPEEKDI